jgi:hypothetical protein
VPVHPDVERLDPAQDEEGVHRPGRAPDRVLEEGELRSQLRVLPDERPRDDVRVAAEVLRERMDHEVGAELDRSLEVGRRERVVDDDELPARVRDLRDRGDVRQAQERVRRRLEEDVAGLLLDRPLDVRRLGGVDVGEADPVALEHAAEEAVGAAVEVVPRDDVISGDEPVRGAFVAARPELKARPNAPPSSEARFSSSAVRVGLLVREYCSRRAASRARPACTCS